MARAAEVLAEIVDLPIPPFPYMAILIRIPSLPADLMDFMRLLDPHEPLDCDHDIGAPGYSPIHHKLPASPAMADVSDCTSEGVPDRASAAVYEALIRRLTSQ